MLKTLNIHFTTEHVFGHHRRVATPEDPASAAKGINVYSFFIRSYFGAYGSAYQIEKDDGKKFWNNYAVLSIVSSILFCVFIFAVFGLQAFICFLLQAFGAVFYL